MSLLSRDGWGWGEARRGLRGRQGLLRVRLRDLCGGGRRARRLQWGQGRRARRRSRDVRALWGCGLVRSVG